MSDRFARQVHARELATVRCLVEVFVCLYFVQFLHFILHGAELMWNSETETLYVRTLFR